MLLVVVVVDWLVELELGREVTRSEDVVVEDDVLDVVGVSEVVWLESKLVDDVIEVVEEEGAKVVLNGVLVAVGVVRLTGVVLEALAVALTESVGYVGGVSVLYRGVGIVGPRVLLAMVSLIVEVTTG